MSGLNALALYHAAARLGEPAAPLLLRWRLSRGKEDLGRWRERLGVASLPRPAGPLAWMHGASVGEAIALLPVVDELVLRGLAVLVTTGTVSSSKVMAGRLPAGALHQFVPLDIPGAARRFLDHWRPDIVGFAESELWPTLLGETARRSIPAVLVNARMSARSFARWRRAGGTAASLLRFFTAILAQTEEDATRFTALGARQVKRTGNLKFDVPPPAAAAEELTAFETAIGGRPCWVAASTSPGEDELCSDVHVRLAPRYPGLLTILVPRQPNRGPAIAAAAGARGLSAQLRSRGGTMLPTTDVYVADTLGEIGLFYRAAPIVFMGKSLGVGGGQNPIEPAKLGAAILHGPAVANFTEIYGLFDAAGGSRSVLDGTGLATALAALLDDPGAAAGMVVHARTVIDENGGAASRTMDALEPILEPLLRARAA